MLRLTVFCCGSGNTPRGFSLSGPPRAPVGASDEGECQNLV